MAENLSVSSEPAERHALYYPYIHIRDESWLKGTILAFQQVRRIVPNRFTVRDQVITKTYSQLEGPAGPLLEAVYVTAPEIHTSQTALRLRIVERLDEIIERYAKDKVPEALQSGPKAYEMHTGKILDLELLDLLKSKDLAWHSREQLVSDSFNWITMHPKLGSAMMSVLALAVARIKGLSVVTPSEGAHYELLANQEEQVFEKLMDMPIVPANIPADVTVEQLAHVVITVGFDLTRLTPEQVCELLKQGKDLRSFRKTVSEFAGRIPAGLDREEREKRLRKEAEAILDEWDKYRAKLPSFAKDAFVDAALDKVPDKAIELGLVAAAGGAAVAAPTIIAALPGLFLTLVVAAGINMFRKHDTPLRFLNRIDKVVDSSIGSIYVPQWSKLADQAA